MLVQIYNTRQLKYWMQAKFCFYHLNSSQIYIKCSQEQSCILIVLWNYNQLPCYHNAYNFANEKQNETP